MRSDALLRLIAMTSILSFFLLISDFTGIGTTPVVRGDAWLTAAELTNSGVRPSGQSTGINPPSGPPGTRITISGSGFRSFTQLESITLGGSNILGNRRVSADGNGDFQAVDLIVPGLNPGVHSVVVVQGTGVRETTSVTSFEVTEEEQAGSSTAASVALADMGDRLAKVFFFDNVTKSWLFYINDPDFTAINTLTDLVDGQPYWFQVKESFSITLNGRNRNFTCVNEGTPQEDCWSIQVW